MPNEVQPTQLKPADIAVLFGSPTVLSTEDPKQFDAMFAQLITCLKPQDLVEVTLIRRYAYETWVSERYARHSALAIERRYRQRLGFLAAKLKQQNARRAAAQASDDANKRASRADIARLIELEDIVLESVADGDAILEHGATELAHNRALESSILFLEQLDRLRTSATARANDALQLLDHYREGLGKRVREEAQAILDAEFREVEKTRQVSHSMPPQ